MKKIPTLFARDEQDRRYVTREVTPGCEWVLAGEGVPTRKYDGTCVMFDGAAWWARREVKPGKAAPPSFVPISTDETTGKTVGWEPIEQSPFAKFHAEAVEVADAATPGTYELVGPKINGNPERCHQHVLVKHEHAEVVTVDGPLTVDTLRNLVIDLHRAAGFEGLVWHHPDGRMAKLKRKDFPA